MEKTSNNAHVLRDMTNASTSPLDALYQTDRS